jgi:subtilisin-like proprotein convertase family protein
MQTYRALFDSLPRFCPALFALTVTMLSAAGQEFSNPGLITIPDFSVANPYPSTILVQGLFPQVSKVTVTLNQLQHTAMGDLQVLLVGPQNQNVMLMGLVGAEWPVNATLTFDDAAPSGIHGNGSPASGNYQPTRTFVMTMQSPAPLDFPTSYGTTLSVFNGTNPNGTWKLFVQDMLQYDSGDIAGGWSMEITTVPEPQLLQITCAGLGLLFVKRLSKRSMPIIR